LPYREEIDASASMRTHAALGGVCALSRTDFGIAEFDLPISPSKRFTADNAVKIVLVFQCGCPARLRAIVTVTLFDLRFPSVKLFSTCWASLLLALQTPYRVAFPPTSDGAALLDFTRHPIKFIATNLANEILTSPFARHIS